MGGLLILFAATLAFLPVSHYRLQSLTVLFVTLACGAIGFLDDFIKLTRTGARSGSPAAGSCCCSPRVTVVVGDRRASPAAEHATSTSRSSDVSVPLSYAWYPFLFIVIAGASNGTNLADGVDGLAAGTGIIALFTYTGDDGRVVRPLEPDPAHRNLTTLDLAIIGAALIGAMVGFLWYNAFPAEVIMGDTGLDGASAARSRRSRS